MGENSNNLENVDRFKEIECLFKLSEATKEQFNIRRSYEWKISFGLWTAIGTLIGFAIKEDYSFSIIKRWEYAYIINDLFLIVLAGIILLVFYKWQKGLRNSNLHDQTKIHAYYSVIHYEMDFFKKLKSATSDSEERNKSASDSDSNNYNDLVNVFENPPDTSKGKLKTWAHFAQIGFTIVFLVLFCIVMWNNKNADDKHDKYNPNIINNYGVVNQ